MSDQLFVWFCFRRQGTARLTGEKCADIAALAENAINVSESVIVRVGV